MRDSRACACVHTAADTTKLVAITGGPGAGKTALIELVRRLVCPHVAIVPEAAGIIYGGGFPRDGSDAAMRAAQRTIYHTQRELERLAIEEGAHKIVLCDRGTLDGLAYWPGSPQEFFADLGTTYERELSRYAAVLQLRTPRPGHGYNHANPIRIESAEQALHTDARLLAIWGPHPNRILIDSQERFLEKMSAAMRAIESLLPHCCADRKAALSLNASTARVG